MNYFKSSTGSQHLSLDLSVPRYRFGTNYTLPTLTDVYLALESLTYHVEEMIGLKVNIGSFSVHRIDFVKHIDVGRINVTESFSRLSKTSIPRFHRLEYSDSTVYFSTGRNKKLGARILCIYDKLREMAEKNQAFKEVDYGKGTLRLEYRFTNGASVSSLCKRLQIPGRTVENVVSESVYLAAFAEVDPFILGSFDSYDPINAVVSLTKRIGRHGARRVLQFLTYYRHFGPDFYKIPELDYSRSAYYRELKLARDASVPFYQLSSLTETPFSKLRSSNNS